MRPSVIFGFPSTISWLPIFSSWTCGIIRSTTINRINITHNIIYGSLCTSPSATIYSGLIYRYVFSNYYFSILKCTYGDVYLQCLFTQEYRKRGKFCWVKVSLLQHRKAIRGESLAVDKKNKFQRHFYMKRMHLMLQHAITNYDWRIHISS